MDIVIAQSTNIIIATAPCAVFYQRIAHDRLHQGLGIAALPLLHQRHGGGARRVGVPGSGFETAGMRTSRSKERDHRKFKDRDETKNRSSVMSHDKIEPHDMGAVLER